MHVLVGKLAGITCITPNHVIICTTVATTATTFQFQDCHVLGNTFTFRLVQCRHCKAACVWWLVNSGKECLSIHFLSLVSPFQNPQMTTVNIATSFTIMKTNTTCTTDFSVVDQEMTVGINLNMPFLPGNVMSVGIFSVSVCILSRTFTVTDSLAGTAL